MNPSWNTVQKITDFVKNHPSSTITHIHIETGVSYSCVHGTIKFLVDKKVLVMKKKGRKYEVNIR